MDSSKNNTLNHAMRGVILKDGIVYVPLEEITKFCQKFPSIKADQVSEVISKAITDLLASEEQLKQVPHVVVDVTK